MTTRADELAAELQAASDAKLAAWQQQEQPEEVAATRERLRTALVEGGLATVTVRSRDTGKHVTVRLVVKQRGPAGGFISRATTEGRVGLQVPDTMMFASDPDRDWSVAHVATYKPAEKAWKVAQGADRLRVWTALHVAAWALDEHPLDPRAEVFMRTTCDRCGHALTDPVSIQRGRGPECAGKRTGSKVAR